MALAAARGDEAAGPRRASCIGGVDAMPPAITAVSDGPHARDRPQPVLPHPWLRDRRRRCGGGRRREDRRRGIPKNIVTDGPVVTKANAAGMQWMRRPLPDLTLAAGFASGATICRSMTPIDRAAAPSAPLLELDRHLEVVRRRRRRFATSTSRFAPARSTASSARTAPASRR